MKLFKHFLTVLALTASVGAQAFEMQKVRIAPFQTQKGADETAHLTRKGYYPVVAMPSKKTLEFDTRLGLAQIKVSADPASPWNGWKLMRIDMEAPADIVGDATFDVTYNQQTLENTPARSSKVTLDVMGNTLLTTEPHNYYISVYPAAVNGGQITLSYYFRNADGSKTQVVSHKVPVRGTAFAKGVPTVIEDRIGAASSYEVTEHKADIEGYKKRVAKMLKDCKIATLQLTYVDHLDSVSFIVVNDEYYDTKSRYGYNRRDYIKRPFDMRSVYQAASMSKVPCGYIYTKMASDGEVDLDVPLYKYYPGLLKRFHPSVRNRVKLITGRMALTHTAGGGGGYGNMKLYYYPGYHHSYINSNITIVQYVIEYLKGKRIDEVAEDYIYNKRGMTDSRYEWLDRYDTLAVYNLDGKEPYNRSESWEVNDYIKSSDFPWDKDRKGIDNNTSYHWRTNSVDCTRFWSWFLEGAELSEDMFNEFLNQKVHMAAGDVSLERGSYTYGLSARTDFSDELGPVTHHTGRNGPFRSLGLVFIERNAAISFFSNSRHYYAYYYPLLDMFIPHAQPLSWTLWVADAGTKVPNWTTTQDRKKNVGKDLPTANSFTENGRVAPSQQYNAAEAAPYKFDSRLSSAHIDLAAAKGSKYAKWTLKRIVVGAPADIAGNVIIHKGHGDVMLVEDSGKTGSVRLDVLGAAKIGNKPAGYDITVYPAGISGGSLNIDYYVTDGKATEVLSHTVPVNGRMFLAGQASRLAETIPAKPQQEGWTVRPFERDIEALKARTLAMIGKKGADIVSMQIGYTDNLGDVTFTVTNHDWFNANNTRKAWDREFTDSDIYQACEAGSLPLIFVVMKMVQDGALDLDTPLVEYCPSLANRFARNMRKKAQKITARHCLQHLSGVSRNVKDPLKISHVPGASYYVSRNDWQLLQWTVEEIAGQSLEELCQKAIFKPLKLKNTSYAWQSSYEDKAVKGYYGTKNPDNKLSWNPEDLELAGSSLRTNASEYSQFLKWVVNGGGLKKATFDSMFEGKTHIAAHEYRRERYTLWTGLGWTVEDNAELGKVAVTSGQNGFWRCTSMVLPERGETFCVFTNTTNKINYYDELAKMFFPTREPLASFGCGSLYPLYGRK